VRLNTDNSNRLKTYRASPTKPYWDWLVTTRNPRIGLIQLQVTDSKTENLRHVIQSLERIGQDCELVVFPEYCMGYSKRTLSRDFLHRIAEPLDGKFVKTVAEKSKEKQNVVVLPIFEKDNASMYNTAVIVDRGQVIGGYRKIHLFDALGFRESQFFHPGSELVLFDVGGMTLGVATCYDLRFPELIKKQVMSGATAVIVPAAWFRGPLKEEQWQTLLMARAAENTSYMIGVGNANEHFIGRSIVVDPFGVKVLDLGYGDRIGRYEIDKNIITNAREQIPVIQQSRKLQDVECRRL